MVSEQRWFLPIKEEPELLSELDCSHGGLAITSWIEAGGVAQSYQEFNWLVDKGGQREQEVELNSGVLETRFPGGDVRGLAKNCKVFGDNTNQYLIDQWILIGGMLCFEVTPISSSQARVVHRGMDLCI